jgi:hypothetical protein
VASGRGCTPPGIVVTLPLSVLDRHLHEAVRRAASLIVLEDFLAADAYLAHAARVREVIREREDEVLAPLEAEL